MIIGWGLLSLLISACAGPGKRTLPPTTTVVSGSPTPAPSVNAFMQQKGYQPQYRHPWPIQNNTTNNEVTKSSAAPSPPEERYTFTRPPVVDLGVPVTAAPREMPIRMAPMVEEPPVTPYESPKTVIAATKPKEQPQVPVEPVVPTEPITQVETIKLPEPEKLVSPEVDYPKPASGLPASVQAPEWPTIAPNPTPIRTPGITVQMQRPVPAPAPVEPVAHPVPEIKAPPFPSLQPAGPPTPVFEPTKSKVEDRREEIREIVKETLKELPHETGPSVPATVPKPVELPLSPTTKESPLVLAIRAYQAKNPDQAMLHLKQFDPQNQDLLLSLMPLLVRLSESSLGTMTPEELASHLDQLQGASSTLKGRAALKTETVCFCKRVVKFGKYDPLGPEHVYQPGEPVELYLELRNFTWDASPSEDKSYAMRLGSSLEIRDAQKRMIWRRDLTTTDSRQSPPSDFYLVYRFALPELPPGAYTLDVQVVDQLDSLRRSTKRSLELRVGSK